MKEHLINFICRFYFVLIMIFLYIPIAVMMVLSVNDSRSRVVWGGFTLRWYGQLLSNRQIREALITTIALAFLSSAIALLIGTAAAFGMHYMNKRRYAVMMGLTNIPGLHECPDCAYNL